MICLKKKKFRIPGVSSLADLVEEQLRSTGVWDQLVMEVEKLKKKNEKEVEEHVGD